MGGEGGRGGVGRGGWVLHGDEWTVEGDNVDGCREKIEGCGEKISREVDVVM